MTENQTDNYFLHEGSDFDETKTIAQDDKVEEEKTVTNNTSYSALDKRKNRIRLITGTAILTALEVVLCLIGNYINIGQVNINLALIPICLGACLYGPICGMFLGLVNGVVTIFSPSTLGFMQYQPLATVFVCLFKTAVAGLVGGFIYKIKSSEKLLYVKVACVALAVPFINTLLFVLGAYVFFLDIFKSMYDGNVYVFILVLIWLNFVVEIAINLVLTPTIYKVLALIKKKKSY